MSESEIEAEGVTPDADAARRRPQLSSAERRRLRAAAHTLHPVASVGQRGLTPQVLAEVDRALNAHALIKVRVFSDDRGEREACLARICDELACVPVQHLGKLLILWRPLAEQEGKSASRDVGSARSAKKAPAKSKVGARTRAKPSTTAARKPKPSSKTKERGRVKDTTGPVGRKAGRWLDEDAREPKANVPRRSRGQPLTAMDGRERPRRSPKAPRATAPSPQAPRTRGRGAMPNPIPGPGTGKSTRASPTVAPRVPGHRSAGGPVGVPRAANPRRRRTKTR